MTQIHQTISHTFPNNWMVMALFSPMQKIHPLPLLSQTLS